MSDYNFIPYLNHTDDRRESAICATCNLTDIIYV